MDNKKNYPLHPGQTHVEPMYTQMPTEEYEALMREVKQLREITAGSRTTIDDIAEIKTLTSEVKALREMNARAQARITELERMDTEHTIQIAKMNGYISTLEENQRWRNFPDEKPEHNGIYIVLLGEHTRTLDVYDTDKGNFRTYKPTAWMPMPKATRL